MPLQGKDFFFVFFLKNLNNNYNSNETKSKRKVFATFFAWNIIVKIRVKGPGQGDFKNTKSGYDFSRDSMSFIQNTLTL